MYKTPEAMAVERAISRMPPKRTRRRKGKLIRFRKVSHPTTKPQDAIKARRNLVALVNRLFLD